MSEKKGPSGRHARAEIESGKIGSDGEVRLYTALSELVLAGVLHSGSMDLIRLFELVGIRKQPAETHAKKPAALPVEQAPVEAEPASRPPRLESADGLRFLYPSLSRGMLAHTKRVRDRALMGGLRPAPFKNADAVALLYHRCREACWSTLKGYMTGCATKLHSLEIQAHFQTALLPATCCMILPVIPRRAAMSCVSGVGPTLIPPIFLHRPG